MITKRSFNIKYDTSDREILKSYYATSSHSELIKFVLDGVIEGKQKAHIAYGPYGSGKSFISTILTSILNGNYNEKEISILEEKYKQVDTEVSSRFKRLNNLSYRYIPVIINGFEGDFETVLIRSLYRSLKKESIFIYTSGVVETISKVVNGWKIKFPQVYYDFSIYLTKIGLDEDSFFELISENNHDLILSFSSFYTNVSAGAELPHNESENFLDVFEYILKKLSKDKIGVFIVYDEFGRLLQNIKPIEIHRFMEQMQGLAELANTGSSNLSTLFITHKPVSHYFKYLDKETRSEFSKIEKRFSVSEIKSDNAMFINITAEVIKSLKRISIDKNMISIQSRGLNKFKLFTNNMNDTEIENKIIIECYPLHPSAIFALPRISSVFGQNERTLFTFLLDDSPFGLNGFLTNSKGYYYPDYLIDYFFTTTDNSEIESNKEVTIYRKSISIIPNIFDQKIANTALRIYKFCLLWNITNSNGYAPLTQSLISYSLGIDIQIVENCLQIFLDSKLLRNNLSRKHLEIIESSAVDLNQEIEKQIQINNQNKFLINETLNVMNPYKIFYPNVYNNKNDMTRFAKVILNIEKFPEYKFQNSSFDLLVSIIIQPEESTYSFIDENVGDINGFLRFNTEQFVSILSKAAAINSLLSDRKFVLEYRNVDLDLNYEKAVIQKKLSDYYKQIFSQKCKYYFMSKQMVVSNVNDFEVIVNNIISEKFSQSIILHNDQINMYTVSKIQENAIISVISLMQKYKVVKLEEYFFGNKPDYLVFYSITKADLGEVRNKIRSFIKENETGNMSDLINIMKSSPFGIRPVLTSLILLFSVIDMWKNIMFFNNDDFIAELPSSYLFEIGLGLKDCKYSYSNFEFENQHLLERIVTEFGGMGEGVQDKSLSIKACSCLYNWYLNLPVIIQLGNSLGLQERYFTRSIEMAKTNPRKALELIIESFDEDTLIEIKGSIENSFNHYVLNFEEKIKNDYNINNWKDWADSQSDILNRSNEFVRLCHENDSITRAYAKQIDRLEIERWPEAMFNVLRTNIENSFAEMSNELNTIEIKVNGISKSIYDVELAKKAQNLKRNLGSLIEANQKYITKSEIEKVVFELIEQFIK